jgi:hypothetical protein
MNVTGHGAAKSYYQVAMSDCADSGHDLLQSFPTESGPMKDLKSLSLLCMDLATFFSRENRLPRLGDSPPPWCYRGWLLPYAFLIHEFCPAVANRWGYYFRTVEAGKLLDEAIPQIAFGAPDQRVFSLLHDWSALIGGDCGGWSDFHMLLEWLSWGLSLN